MTSTFSLSMTKGFLQSAMKGIETAEEREPGKEYEVHLSIDLFPDGIGYESSNSHITLIPVEKSTNNE